MLTVGVDLSAEIDNTCMATVHWASGRASVRRVQTQVGDPDIVGAAKAADKIGIDCPFGWPALFVEYVRAHEAGDAPTKTGIPMTWRNDLAYRVTDQAVRREVPRLRPLSVSADRIGHAAFRCAGLLATMRAQGVSVNRSGISGKVVEVYPSGSLFQWGLRHQGYKKAKNRPALRSLVSSLAAAAPWLDWGVHRRLCESNDDAFDSVVAALTARASIMHITRAPQKDQIDAANTEGWISLPRPGSLADLPS
jgi:predicted nuclease with RNAse H fold